MLQERERVIESLGVALEVPQHQVLALAAKADAQQPFSACGAIDKVCCAAVVQEISTTETPCRLAQWLLNRQAYVLAAGCLQ